MKANEPLPLLTASNVQQYLCLSSLYAPHQHTPSAPYKAETSIDIPALM